MSGHVTSKATPNPTSKYNSNTLLALEIALNVGYAVAVGFLARYLVDKLTEQYQDKDRPLPKVVTDRLKRILARRGQQEIPQLDSYELQMAEVVLDPEDIDVAFADIGGLDDTKREIYELAVMPLVQPELFQGKLLQPTRGILLFGKPGTGKTMMAKALAKEAQAVFIPLQLSKILNKWVGESNKLIAGTFALAQKLAPAIIFIDELDTFLKSNNTENQYLDTIKSEFLNLWDGVTTDANAQVLVLGATNKPQAIDPAIQRRMPRVFRVPLPDEKGRRQILELLFRDENLTPSARDRIPQLARDTLGYSGSDLKEVAKAAAMVGVQEVTQEYARNRVMGGTDKVPLVRRPVRPISQTDLTVALQKVGPTGAAAQEFGREADMEEEQQQRSGNVSLQQLLHLVRSLSNVSGAENYGDAIPNLN